MIHEHDDLVLASAAIDFGLSPDESDRLARSIADCPICAERAGAYRRQLQLLADLPELEPSDAVRRRVQAAAVAGRASRSGAPLLLLAAALAIGAALALLAVIAGGAFRSPRLLAEYPPIDAPASPAASAIAVASAGPGAVPSQPAGPGDGGALMFAPNTIAQVVSTNLRLRSQPRIATDSIKFEPFLTVDDRLFVVAGPVNATNHDWYEVAVRRPSDPGATWPIGWVATADIDGTPWIGSAAPACPEAPTVESLGALWPLDALACYGHRPIAVRAYLRGGEPVVGCAVDAPRTCLGGPAWLAGSGGRMATIDGRRLDASPTPAQLPIARDPAGSVSNADLPTERMIELVGAFDDPAAAGCSLGGPAVPTTTLTTIDAVLRCRATFVLSAASVDPIGLTQTAAITTTDGLRVRSLPLVDDTSARYEPLLASGTRLVALEGPVIGSGYDWYRVLAPTVTREGGEPMLGWIAVASKTGEIWAKDVALACPTRDGPIALSDLQRLTGGSTTDGGMACYQAALLTTIASVTTTCQGPQPGPTASAGWLGEPARMSVQLTDRAAVFGARVHPDLAGRIACDLGGSARWAVTGHFQDPDTETCARGSTSEASAELARYRCGSIFVVTDLSPAS